MQDKTKATKTHSKLCFRLELWYGMVPLNGIEPEDVGEELVSGRLPFVSSCITWSLLQLGHCIILLPRTNKDSIVVFDSVVHVYKGNSIYIFVLRNYLKYDKLKCKQTFSCYFCFVCFFSIVLMVKSIDNVWFKLNWCVESVVGKQWQWGTESCWWDESLVGK